MLMHKRLISDQEIYSNSCRKSLHFEKYCIYPK